MTFGERLRELRKSRHMTQKELGKALFISERVISYYEQNERFPNDTMTLIRIAEFFDVSVDYLFDMPSAPTQSTQSALSNPTPDLLEVVTLYTAASDYDKGRILQFMLDLQKERQESQEGRNGEQAKR